MLLYGASTIDGSDRQRKPYDIRERAFLFACDVIRAAQELQLRLRILRATGYLSERWILFLSLRDPDLLALQARIPGATMAAELEARHSCMVAVRAMRGRPLSVGAGQQQVGSLAEMKRLELLVARFVAQRLAARAEQATDSGVQKIGRE